MRPERSTGVIVPAAVLACGLVSAVWPAQCVAADAAVSPWATGGAKVDAGSTDGKPVAVAGTALPIAQATPWPGYVIRGGTIPPGWQPQAVPYQAVGPDGRPVTILYAPTYTFTYQIGPPVPMLSPVNRPQAYPPPAPMPSTMAGPMQVNGWNYQTQGAAVPVPALAPTVARYQPTPFQYPTNAPQLAGQPLSPPASSPWQAAPVPPPSAWVPSSPPAPPPPALPPPPAASPPPVAFSSPPPVVPQAPPAATHMWRVVGVEDGDTLTCLDQTNQQQKVRLAEIDAPELGQDFGKVSREALAGMVFGKTVEVVDDGKDRYGRWLAHVLVNGEDVNRQMVATGNAWHYKAYSRDSSLAQLQSQARGQQIGLWAQPNPQPPWEFRATEKP